MKYLEKLNNITLVVSKIKEVVDLNSIQASVYVDSEYFKDSFELGNDALGFYIVTDKLNEKEGYGLELKLNDISINYVFTVTTSKIFDDNFRNDTTEVV